MALRSRTIQSLGAWLLALCQIFFVAGCRESGRSGGGGAVGSTAAGANAGVNIGEIAYEVLHHNYTTTGETAKAQALENRKADFVGSINQILPSEVGQDLFPTLLDLLPLVDDGTVEGAVADVDAILVDLMNDQAALEGLVALLSSTGDAGAVSDRRTTYLLVNRLLAYPKLDDLARAIFALVQENDGVDDQGNPNGERNLFAALQGLLSRRLLSYQPSPTAGQNLQSSLQGLSGALLADDPLNAYPDLGAPAWAVRLDVHGNPKVVADAATGQLPAPFVDVDGDGAADVDAEGRPVDAAGTPIEIPAFGSEGSRDSFGRALGPGGGHYYDYFDAKRTLLSELLLFAGELLERDVPSKGVLLLDAISDRVPHDNGTPSDPSDDYETLSPDSPLLDLTHAQFEVVRQTPLPELLRGLAEVIKNDPQKFAAIVDKLLVALKQASQAAATAPAPGANQALIDDLLPLLEDTLRPRGRNGQSAMRALLQAFNQEQRRLQTLPQSFAKMMKFHDFRNQIPADANNKSVMQRLLEMMQRADRCDAPLAGNMAEFYLDAMAGNQRILGINISIGTIHRLLDVSFLRRLLCSGIRADDVRALKDFNDTGALDAMKPLAKVFSDRGETTLLKDIMLGLGDHYDAAMRPTEPMVVAILESGAVEDVFEVIDAMTQVPVPGTNDVVADVLADTMQAMVDTSRTVTDRRGNQVRSLLQLVLEPMDRLKQTAQQRNAGPVFDSLVHDVGEVLLATYTDDMGTADPADDVERWKWDGLKAQLGRTLEFAAATIPTDQAGRDQWADDMQHSMEVLLTGRDTVLIMDVLATIAASPHKQEINDGIANLFTPQPNAQEDVFGAILTLLAESVAKKPQRAPSSIDPQALGNVMAFLGRQLDPSLNRFSGIGRLALRLIGADDGLLLLRILRNTFDMGPNGAEEPPIAVLQSVFADIGAAGGQSGPLTADSLKATLRSVHEFINDAEKGLPHFIEKIKDRPNRQAA